MGDKTAIEWTDATVNFWWGCTKVGPGCEFCYAEAFDRRLGGAHWGQGVQRRKIKGAVALIHQLDNGYADWAADYYCAAGNAPAFGLPAPSFGPRRRVFIQSMSDLFDLEVPIDWFTEAWHHIERCDRIGIQIVTKRVSAVEKRLAAIGKSWPAHAGLMISVVNQQEADRDIPRLQALKAKLGIPWVGISAEPLLGPVVFSFGCEDYGMRTPIGLDWVIVGGESGPKARPMHPDWVRGLRNQCAGAGVPFFFKQWGNWAPSSELAEPWQFQEATVLSDGRVREWQADFPNARLTDPRMQSMRRVGKKAAGAVLDGRQHREFPKL